MPSAKKPVTPAQASPAETPDRMVGFPPSADSLVTLATWQDPPNVRWAFQHMREIIPTQPIPAGPRPRPLATALDSRVGETELTRLDGSAATAVDVFADTWTDAVIVLHDGEIVDERYFGDMTPTTPHLLMSVTKSVVGCVAGILAGQGKLDPEAPVTKYVPEVSDSGYDGATVRHLLDMRTGVAFREAYVEPDAEVRVMERSMGWRPLLEGDPLGMYDYLATLGTAGAHGGDFTYRSADTDMLGWVLERASGRRMADLVSSLLWVPIGAEHDANITCDPVGSAIHDGGMSAVARDLARFGQLLLDDGFVDGEEVVPASWLADARNPPPAVRQAFANTDNEQVLTGGWYRSKFWFVPGPAGDALVCLGIHGQMVYVNQTTRTVCVKFSSWPDAQNPSYLIDTLRAFGAIGTRLSSTSAANA